MGPKNCVSYEIRNIITPHRARNSYEILMEYARAISCWFEIFNVAGFAQQMQKL